MHIKKLKIIIINCYDDDYDNFWFYQVNQPNII